MTRTNADGVIGLALLGAVVALALALTHCAPGFDDPNPAAVTATKDYPCGILGTTCTVEPRWQDDQCCGQDEACPGPHAGDCAPGFCCFDAPFDPSPQYGKTRDAGAPDGAARPRTMHRIRKAVP